MPPDNSYYLKLSHVRVVTPGNTFFFVAKRQRSKTSFSVFTMANCSGLGPTVRLALGRCLGSLVDCRAKVPSNCTALFKFHPVYCTSVFFVFCFFFFYIKYTTANFDCYRLAEKILTPFCGYCGFLSILKKDSPSFISLDSSIMRFCRNLPPSGFSSLKTLKLCVAGPVAQTKAKTSTSRLFV